MNPEQFYAAKRKRIFRDEMIFNLAMLFIVAIGSAIVFMILKYW